MAESTTTKANVLVFGGGAVGAIATLNIEAGGLGQVTAVLRSNFQVVRDEGYKIESVDHGSCHGWRPSKVVNSVPNVDKEGMPPFDLIITTTKNCPDIPPSLADVIAPAVTPGQTVIVMVQNGINIEKPMFAAFPQNIVLSGVSLMDAHERQLGEILHENHDILYLGAFRNPNIQDRGIEEAAAHRFIEIYRASGKAQVIFSDDVPLARWRKLIFNGVMNPLCAITGLDSSRVRLTESMVDGLVRPAMKEVFAAAKALGHHLPDDTIDRMIDLDPIDLYLKPSMLCDSEKGNFMEIENLVGEPLREAERVGVPTPNLKVIYEICKAFQWRIKEAKGMVTTPPRRVQ
ncbi:6-phosphogluconate dehydrogenase [Aspergillus avenaceus]|uniref:2-dehydropantoate 2-reductase n=1 Tax=Aspergillus avenaceus TaxID=36643 RepID=A0A5N6U654_ASPAV|nr:6-phosphogluconate dehydrogenase [Aspergillus avenaceus]